MKKTPIALALAILDLGVSFLSFTEQQYFSAVAMVLIFALALLSVIIFLLSYDRYFDKPVVGEAVLALLVLISIVISYYDLAFNLVSPALFHSALNAFFRVSLAAIISIISIYMIGLLSGACERIKIPKRAEYAAVAICLIVAALFAYAAMYAFNHVNWGGVDELAANYYSSYLFIHGANPYTSSMKPILDARGVFPTVLLNGSYEYDYDYPALSFLAYVPVTALGITSFFSFVAILVFLSVVAAFAVYHRSGMDKHVLIPIFAWLMLSFSLASVSNTFLAVSIFLLFAYIMKEKPIISGLLLGLAASVTQVAWFAIPFFYVLALRQHGTKETIKQIAASILVFVIINIYFIAISPKVTISNLFALFGQTKLPFYGPNIMQFFASFYSVSYSFPTFVSALVLLWALAMLYLYPKGARPFLAIVPAMVFFLSWRNISIYAIPYIPIMLLICYHRDKLDKKDKDIPKTKKPMIYSMVAIIIVSVVVMVFSHYSYANANTLHINNIMPIVYVGYNGTYLYGLGGLMVNVTNNGRSNETVSFLMVSRSPNNEAYVLGTTVKTLVPMSYYNYQINYTLPLINNSTKIFVFVFSKDYIAGKEENLQPNYHP